MRIRWCLEGAALENKGLGQNVAVSRREQIVRTNQLSAPAEYSLQIAQFRGGKRSQFFVREFNPCILACRNTCRFFI
jgi:hypothetical protein